MAISRTYLCPDCDGQFVFMHHPNDEPPPKFCPLCGSNVSGEKKKRKSRLKSGVNTPPHIRGVAGISGDQVYRQLETASEVRQEQAAEMLGVDKSKLSDMKMTNMKDNLREGDFTAMSNAPAQATMLTGSPVAVDGMKMFFQDNNQGAEYAKSVSQGPEPRVGSRMIDMVGSKHHQLSRQLVSAGQQSTYKAKRN